jgi:hypothetical protein
MTLWCGEKVHVPDILLWDTNDVFFRAAIVVTELFDEFRSSSQDIRFGRQLCYQKCSSVFLDCHFLLIAHTSAHAEFFLFWISYKNHHFQQRRSEVVIFKKMSRTIPFLIGNKYHPPKIKHHQRKHCSIRDLHILGTIQWDV